MAEFIVGNPIRNFARRHPRLRRFLWRVDFLLIWTLVSLFRLLPVNIASRLGYRAARLICPRLKRKSAVFRNNLEIAFPEKSAAEVEDLLVEAWGRAGRILAEYPHLDVFLRDEKRLEIDIREPVPAFEQGGRPCIVVTAHHCNWEIVGCAMARLGMPNATLYSPASNPYLDRMLAESREVLNCQLLARDNSARLLMRALKEGRTAGLVCDRRVEFGDAVTFFGKEKTSTLMPAKLALKFGCPMVPAQVKRTGDASYRVIFHPPIEPGDNTATEAEQALDMIQQLHWQFEDWIREEPADWLASKRFWWKKKYRYDTSKKEHLRKLDPKGSEQRIEDESESNAA